MRIFLVALIMVPSAVLAQTKDQVGRWQLFQGEYRFVNIEGEQHWSRALFKLDTSTGKLYECQEWQYDDPKQEDMIIQRTWCEPFDKELTFRKDKK